MAAAGVRALSPPTHWALQPRPRAAGPTATPAATSSSCRAGPPPAPGGKPLSQPRLQLPTAAPLQGFRRDAPPAILSRLGAQTLNPGGNPEGGNRSRLRWKNGRSPGLGNLLGWDACPGKVQTQCLVELRVCHLIALQRPASPSKGLPGSLFCDPRFNQTRQPSINKENRLGEAYEKEGENDVGRQRQEKGLFKTGNSRIGVTRIPLLKIGSESLTATVLSVCNTFSQYYPSRQSPDFFQGNMGYQWL